MDVYNVAAKYEVSRPWAHRLCSGGVRLARSSRASKSRLGGARCRRSRKTARSLARNGAARCDVGGITRRAADDCGVEHNLADDRAGRVHRQKRSTPTNSVPLCAEARRRWHDTRPVRDDGGRVFIDEFGVTTDLLRRYGRSPSRPAAQATTPHVALGGHTVAAAIRVDGPRARRPSSMARSTVPRSWPTSSKCSSRRCVRATSSSSTA